MSTVLFRMVRCCVCLILWTAACASPTTPTVEPSSTPVPTPVAAAQCPTASPCPTFEPTNNPPVINDLSISPMVVCPGDPADLSASVMDLDGDELRPTWKTQTGTISDPQRDGANLTADYLAADLPGTDTIELSLSDGRGPSVVDQDTIEVRANCPIVITITDPVDTLSCSGEGSFCQWETTGATRNAVYRSDLRDLRLYILIYPVNPGGSGWYIQVQPGSIQPSDGSWSQDRNFVGNPDLPVEAGQTLKVMAVVVSRDAVADTITGTRKLSEMQAQNNDNVVLHPGDIVASVFYQSDEIKLTIGIP